MSNQLSDSLVARAERLDPDSLPTLLKFAAAICNVDLADYTGETSAETAEKIAQALSEPVSHIIAVVVAFVLLFVVFMILLGLLLKLVNYVLSNSPLRSLNRALGFIVGGAFAFIIAWLLCAVFTWFLSLPAIAANEWAQTFEGGAIYNFFRSFDPMEILLSF